MKQQQQGGRRELTDQERVNLDISRAMGGDPDPDAAHLMTLKEVADYMCSGVNGYITAALLTVLVMWAVFPTYVFLMFIGIGTTMTLIALSVWNIVKIFFIMEPERRGRGVRVTREGRERYAQRADSDSDGSSGGQRRVTLHPSFFAPEHLRMLLMDRDFNSDDYEMLLQLDQDTPTQMLETATEFEIARLPVITLDKSQLSFARSKEDTECTVCLECFQLDDKLKLLPCLHRFHERCANDWLRIKAECPICKFTVRG